MKNISIREYTLSMNSKPKIYDVRLIGTEIQCSNKESAETIYTFLMEQIRKRNIVDFVFRSLE